MIYHLKNCQFIMLIFESTILSDQIVEGFIFIFKDPASIIIMWSIFFMQGLLWLFANKTAFKWFTLALAVQIFIFVTANVITKRNMFYLSYLYELTALLPWSVITMLFEPISELMNQRKMWVSSKSLICLQTLSRCPLVKAHQSHPVP